MHLRASRFKKIFREIPPDPDLRGGDSGDWGNGGMRDLEGRGTASSSEGRS